MTTGSSLAGRRHPTPAAAIRIGCSGWLYRSWRGAFYPKDLPVVHWLEYYATHFDTVEINGTFYRLPERTTFAAWRRRVPETFSFAVKASRYLTHLKRLRDPQPPVRRLFDRASGLRRMLEVVLYQLPATLRFDKQRLDAFVSAIARRRRVQHVIEFRDPSWYRDDVFRSLEDRGVSVCQHDMPGSAFVEELVGPILYRRFHGTSGRYSGSYSAAALAPTAKTFLAAARAGVPVFGYFNNDVQAQAVGDARRLRQMLGLATR